MSYDGAFKQQGHDAARELLWLLSPDLADSDDNTPLWVHFDELDGVIVVLIHEPSEVFKLKEFVQSDGTFKEFKVYLNLIVPYHPNDPILHNYIKTHLTAHEMAKVMDDQRLQARARPDSLST